MGVSLVVLLLAAPGLIRVEVEGGATEVIAVRDGVIWARAPVRDGVAELAGLADAAYDLRALGPGVASAFERGVRPGRGPGADARLRAVPVFEVAVSTEPGARVWVDGVPHPPRGLRLPAGMHRLLVDHSRRVSSAERWVRVAGGPLAVEAPLDAGLVVTGRVLDAKGQPVPGARVEAFADGFATGRAGFAGPSGRFGVSGFRGDVVSVRATAPGHAAALRRVLYYPGEERARIEVVLAAGSGVAMAGVTDPRGRPVRAAEATLLPDWYEAALEEPRLRAHHAVARRTGPRPRFDGLRPGATYRILVAARGHRPGATEFFVAPRAGTTLALPPLVLDAGETVAGLAPPRATVVCTGPDGRRAVRTGRDGAFRFEGLDPGAHMVFLPDLDETRRPAAGDEVVLTAPAPAERAIRGAVFDADNRPLAGVAVSSAGRTARTGDEGRFELAGLPAGRARFALGFTPGAGCRALADDPHLPLVERGVPVGTEVRVRLERAGTMRLRLDPGDRVLARARVLLEGTTGVRLRRVLPRKADLVEIADLPVGSYVVEVAAPGLLGTGGAVVPVRPGAPAEPTELALRAGRSGRGTVVLRRWVKPPVGNPSPVDLEQERGFVRVFDAAPERVPASCPVEADGSFLLEGLPAARVLLTAAVPGFPVGRVVVDLTDGDATDVKLVVQDGVQTAVKILGFEDAPLPGARVRFVTPEGVELRDLAALGRFDRVVADDEETGLIRSSFRFPRGADGRVTVPFLAPGSYRVVVAADGYKSVRVGIRAFAAGALAQIPFIPELPRDWAAPIRLAREEN